MSGSWIWGIGWLMMSAFLVGPAIWLLLIGSSMTSDADVVFLLGGWWRVLQHGPWIVFSFFWVLGRVFFFSPGVFCPFYIGVYFLVLFGPHRSVFSCWSLLHTLCILLSCWWMVVVVFLLWLWLRGDGSPCFFLFWLWFWVHWDVCPHGWIYSFSLSWTLPMHRRYISWVF